MTELHIDIETKSRTDLRKAGVYKYTEDADFEVMLFAYSIDGKPVKCIDLTKYELPEELVEMIKDPNVVKWAHNATFERVALSRMLGGEMLDPSQWRCTMIHAAELGLPLSLDKLGVFLRTEAQKDSVGKRLITKFSIPNRAGEFNDPLDHPQDWQSFIDYCIKDVETEMDIAEILNKTPMVDSEWELYALDQKINDAGLAVDRKLTIGAITANAKVEDDAKEKLDELTGLANPKSAQQLKGWLAEQGVHTNSIDKAAVENMLADKELPEIVREVLELRKSISNTSVKKFEAINNMACSNGRVHGLLQFYGAARTGRWAGRGIQLQNLPRNKVEGEELDTLRDKVREGAFVSSDELKQLIRTAIIAPDGYELLVSDFSAIEARVLAWVASEEWVLEAFEDHGKIYEATAAQMYKTTIDEVDKDMRQKGKVAVLACGYGGGVNALLAMGAEKMGLKESELQPIVNQWRQANPNIVKLWYDVERAAKGALAGLRTKVAGGKIRFRKDGTTLFMKLPSGRELAYQHAKLVGDRIEYKGQGSAVAFMTQSTWGGKLVENLTQAIARDVLAESMLNLDGLGFKVIGHVHDEVLIEDERNATDIDEIEDIMSIRPKWAPDLPLNAEGFKAIYYKK